MSRARKRQRARNAARGRGRERGLHPAWIIVGGALAGVLVVGLFTQGRGSGTEHPAPRVAAMAPDVLPAARYAEYPRVAQAYEMTAAVPMVIDGLYCYCHCHEHSDHYSLLDCFTSDHAARCDICMSEAVLAHDMTKQGASPDQIRAEVDRIYGT